MNELIYSFIGSLRVWLHENECELLSHGIKFDISPYTLHYGTTARFIHEHFEAGFSVWEKLSWNKAMSDIEFVDWRVADRDPNCQVEWMHHEYAAIQEMWKELDTLRDQLIAADQAET